MGLPAAASLRGVVTGLRSTNPKVFPFTQFFIEFFFLTKQKNRLYFLQRTGCLVVSVVHQD